MFRFIGVPRCGFGPAMLFAVGFLGLIPAGSTSAQSDVQPTYEVQQTSYGICGHCRRPRSSCRCNAPSHTAPQTRPADEGPVPPVADTPPAPQLPAQIYRPAAAQSSLAQSAPFMMGDSFSGGGVSLRLPEFGLNAAHPAAVTSRINIAENGTPIPQDRIFFSHRTYHNVAPIEVLVDDPTAVPNARTNSDVNRETLGFEKTFWDGMASFEMRVPFNSQLDSSLDVNYINPGPNPVAGVPITGLNSNAFELGNISTAFKFALIERQNFLLSSGVSFMLPTARSVNVSGSVNTFYQGTNLNFNRFQFLVTNETYNLAPFVAMTRNWSDLYFSQSFFQIDVPLVASHAAYAVDGTPTATPNNGTLKVEIQTLLRINQQFGVWLMRNNPGVVRNWAGLFEVAYTGTLNNAKQNSVNLDGPGSTNTDAILTVGPQFKRQDIVNINFGSAIDVRRMNIIAGYVIPLNSGDRKPFDGEFTFQVNRRF